MKADACRGFYALHQKKHPTLPLENNSVRKSHRALRERATKVLVFQLQLK